MTRVRSLTRAAIFATTIIIASANSTQAQDACRSFPEVSWWGNLTHDKVTQYVAMKHRGDWSSYVTKWERQLIKIERIYNNNSRIVLRKLDIVVEGKALARYVEKVRQRVAVNRCLAQKASDSASLGSRHGKERS